MPAFESGKNEKKDKYKCLSFKFKNKLPNIYGWSWKVTSAMQLNILHKLNYAYD